MSVLRRCRRVLPAVAVVVGLSASLTLAPEDSVGAVVVRHRGFAGRVDGDPGWFGSFSLAGIGPAWCIDNGLVAPDADLGYQPIDLSEMAGDTRAALAWLVGSRGPATDDVGAAGLALAAHHLVGARYPSGPLDVHRLTPAAMVGFGPSAAAVVAAARAAVDDATAHAHLRGPYRLTLGASAVPAGAAGRATATVTDGRGNPVVGVAVRFGLAGATARGATTLTTDAHGVAVVGFRAGAGDNAIDARATLPDLALAAYAPTRSPAQRVIRPRRVEVRGRAAFAATPPPGTVQIHKEGDAEAWVPVAGARFEVAATKADGHPGPVVATLVTDHRGDTPTVRLSPGRYVVREAAPPAGYQAAGPWPLTLAPGQRAVLRAPNAAVRGRASIEKVDAVTGRPLAGARLRLAYDADRDGSFETALAPIRTSRRPTVRHDLLPGRYRLLEVRAPDGYLIADQPVDFEVTGGRTATVRVQDQPRPAPPPTTTPPPTTPPPTTPPPTTPPPTTPPPTTPPPTTPPPTTPPPTPPPPTPPPPTTPPPTTQPPSTPPPTTPVPPPAPPVPPSTTTAPTTLGPPPVTVTAPTPTPTPTTAATPPSPALARTGTPIAGLLALGAGLCLLGSSACAAGRRRRPAAEAVGRPR